MPRTPKKRAKARPSTNGGSKATQFAAGNPGGPGNPFAAQTARLRAALLKAVTPKDIEAIAKKLVAAARRGETPAIKELLDRTIGKATQAVELSGPGGGPITVGTSVDDQMRKAMDELQKDPAAAQAAMLVSERLAMSMIQKGHG